MSQKSIERKTLFLYPNPEDLKPEDGLIEILHLITDISRISHIANEVINKIMSSGCFSSIRCKPSISLKYVEEYMYSDFECENVRICITKYCGKDYTSYYQKVIDDFKNEKSDISHLVAITIGETKKTYFHEDSQGNFDVIIEASLDSLDLILESIMLDIALYHYFVLENDLASRKKFNTYKWEYISTKFSDDERKLYFNSANPSQLKYFPFSLPYVKRYNLQRTFNSYKAIIDDLIKGFGNFVAKTINEKLFYNENCCIRTVNSGKIDYDNLSSFLSKNPTVNHLISEKKSFIVQFFYQNSIDFKESIVIQLDQAPKVEDWLKHINEGKKVSTYLLCADEGGF